MKKKYVAITMEIIDMLLDDVIMLSTFVDDDGDSVGDFNDIWGGGGSW